MSDWFNDPFFDETSNSNDIFAHANEMFRGIDRHFQQMMKDQFDLMGPMLGYDKDYDSNRPRIGMNNTNNNSRSRVEEVDANAETSGSRSGKSPKVEEPDDFSRSNTRNRSSKVNLPREQNHESFFSGFGDDDFSNGKSYCYCSSQVSYMNGDGTVNMKRKDTDSTGKTHMAEMRRMGDKTVVYDRKVDSDGKTTDSRKVHGMSDDEVDSFNQKWDSKVKDDPFLSHMSRRGANGIGYSSSKRDSNALGYDTKKSSSRENSSHSSSRHSKH